MMFLIQAQEMIVFLLFLSNLANLQTQLDVLNFTLRVWVNSSDYAKLKWKLNETIVKVFAKENIEIPYNKLDVNIRNN